MKFKLTKAVHVLNCWLIKIIMRVFIFFLCTTVFGWNTANTFSQEKIVIKKDQTVNVDKVFKLIKKQTDFRFIYPKNIFNNIPEIKLKKGEITVEELLLRSLENTAFKFSLSDSKNIFIEKVDTKIKTHVKPQDIVINGVVLDNLNTPLPGASVLEKNTTNGVQTDFDGKFSIKVLNKNAVLEISYLGYYTQEIKFNGKTDITVVLKENAARLDEIVVVGYGKQKKADLTGAVSTINGDKLTVSPLASTTNSLAGQIPGLTSRQVSGEPGKDAANITIRGFGTALVIVDGVQRDFNDLDPNSIESVTVLKDASAAIFGARAGNGVILVTTKRGKKQKIQFQLNTSTTLQGFTSFPEPLDAGRWTELWLEAQMNDNIAPANYRFTPEDVQKYKDGTDPQYANTNWFDVAVRDWSPQTSHNMSLRGGNDKISYYGLIGTLSQEGFVKTGDHVYNRYNIISNVDVNITDNLKASMNLSIINSDLTAPQRSTTNNNTTDNRNIFFQDLFTTEPIHPAFYPDPTKIPNTGTPYNPIAGSSIDIAGYRERRITNTNIAGIIEYKIPFVNGLSTKLLVNHVQNDRRNKNFVKSFNTYDYDYVNDVYTPVLSGEPTSLELINENRRVLTSQLSLNYKKEIGKHNISGLLLYETIDTKSDTFSASRTNFISTSVDQLFAGGLEDQNNGGSAFEEGRISYVGRINYNFDKKYLLQLSGRYDASTKFAPESRNGFFPSISLGWRMSEEDFLNESNTVNNLKLRLSYSQLGFDDVGNFEYLAGFNTSATGALFGGEAVPAIFSRGIPNRDFSWEEMTIYNMGVDFGLFSNKITGEFNAFYRDRKGIIGYRTGSIPNTFGATGNLLPPENLNNQSNRGFEMALGTKGRINEIKYNIEGNLSWTRAKWESFDEGVNAINPLEGEWVNRMFGFKSDGLFTSQDEIDNHAVQDGFGNLTIRPGDIKYIDISGPNGVPDGIIDTKHDRTVIGRSVVPEIFFGLNSSLTYKSFDLNFLLQGATNSTIRVSPSTYINQRFGTSVVYEGRWTPENNNTNARFPRRTGSTLNNNKQSDFWTVDGGYLRLKSINLGYTLPEIKGFNKIRISVSGTNLLTFDNGASELGIDPEVPGGGPGGFYYPAQRTLSLNLNLSL